jgi:putative ABC transport system permease protein
MVSHYLRIARRIFHKYRYYTALNVIGLACGMFGALIIAKYVGASLQIDSFHANRSLIYSVTQQESIDGDLQPERNSTYQGVAKMMEQFPEVRHTTTYSQHVEALVFTGDNDGEHESFTENTIFVSDSGFFKIFTYQFLEGKAETALTRPNSIVITEPAAHKYFGNASAIGKTLSIRTSWGEEKNYEVTGVIRDMPQLTRFRFQFVVNRSPATTNELWDIPDYTTHVLVDEKTEVALLQKKAASLMTEVPELRAANKDVELMFRSIADVRLTNTELLLSILGVVICVICWANYLNQSIAQAYWRSKEIGVLRILGATKGSLRMQFAVESFLTAMIALLVVVTAYIASENWLKTVTDGHLLPLIGDPTAVNSIFLLVFVFGTGLGATVPTLVLLRQHLEGTLRSTFAHAIGGIAIRKIFVVLQFSSSALLMLGTFIVSGQLKFMESKDKGMDLNHVLVVKAPIAKDTTWVAKRATLQLFKQQSLDLPFVAEVTSSTTVPSEEYRQETYLSIKGEDSKTLVHQNGVDENFFSLYRIEFAAGRDFIPDARAKNRESVILNESAARALGFLKADDAISRRLVDHEDAEMSYEVIGVVRDYHQTSLRYEVRPLAFKYNLFRGHCSMRIDANYLKKNKLNDVVSQLRNIWKKSYPDASFDYFLLDEKFRAQDREDQYFGSLFSAFTILSVVLSGLGLFGLSILVSTRRQKEVGIRKTFGATSLNILVLFMRGYLGQMMLALTIGCSAAYVLMSGWLANYAYRIEIGPQLILSASLTLIAIFIFTVSFHTVKASLENPVRILRN